MNSRRFPDHEVIAEVQTDDPEAPSAILARVTNPTAPGAKDDPWVVWPLYSDGTRGNGRYCFFFGWITGVCRASNSGRSRASMHCDNQLSVMRVPGFQHLKNPDDPQAVTLRELASDGIPGEDIKRYSYENMTVGLSDLPDYVSFSGRSDPRRTVPLCDLDLEHNVEEAEKFLARREPAIVDSDEGGNNWGYRRIIEVLGGGLPVTAIHWLGLMETRL